MASSGALSTTAGIWMVWRRIFGGAENFVVVSERSRISSVCRIVVGSFEEVALISQDRQVTGVQSWTPEF